MTPFVLSLLTVVSTLLGGLFVLHRHRQLHFSMALAGGILVAVALLELLPGAFEIGGHSKYSSFGFLLVAAALGFFWFYGIDHLIHRHSGKHHHQAQATIGEISAIGIAIHAFLDGLAIGGAFQASAKIAASVAIAVIGHDFGDGVTAITVVLGSKGKMRTSIAWLIITAVAPLLGCQLAMRIAVSTTVISWMLAFFAGSFLFVGPFHLFSSARREGPAHQSYFAFGIGVLSIVGIHLIT